MVSVSGTGRGPEAIGDPREGLNTRFRNCGTRWPGAPSKLSLGGICTLPSPGLQHMGFIQRRHSQAFHRAGKVFANFK